MVVLALTWLVALIVGSVERARPRLARGRFYALARGLFGLVALIVRSVDGTCALDAGGWFDAGAGAGLVGQDAFGYSWHGELVCKTKCDGDERRHDATPGRME